MGVELNHTIVPSTDSKVSAQFIAGVLGLDPPAPFGHFMGVALGNGVTLDYDTRDDFTRGHYAFLVSDEEFEGIFERVRERGITFWADPGHREQGVINTRDGGRGFYFSDPDGHNMEVLTRPYGS